MDWGSVFCPSPEAAEVRSRRKDGRTKRWLPKDGNVDLSYLKMRLDESEASLDRRNNSGRWNSHSELRF